MVLLLLLLSSDATRDTVSRLNAQDSEGSFQLYIDKGRLGDEFKVRAQRAVHAFRKQPSLSWAASG